MANSSFFGTSGTTASVTNTIQTSVDAAEAAKTAAEAAQAAAETAKTAAETAETNAETAESNAGSAQTNAQTAENNAAASATAAATSATAAASSATNAAASAAGVGNQAAIATTKASEAATSATNAATSETNASTSETNASTSATNAATSATNAATSATAAQTAQTAAETAKTNAETAETNAASSASGASTSATAASTSATAASTSASAASTSETNAGTSATNAANSASAASTSATNAATSATNASNSATASQTAQTAAETAKTAAETAETNAETAETNAATSATNAASSASAASTSATAASNSASTASTNASNSATSATNASNSASAASTSASNASTSETNASNSASSATTSASNASTSASQAATSATNASTSATAAQTAQTAAETAKTAAETAKAAVDSTFDNFDDRFLGTFTTANEPTTDNDGNALSVGAVYYNSTAGEVRFYSGSSWDAPASSAATSATNASNSASAASTSASNAATSATNAAASASGASTSATNASNSASAASTSETNASTSATSASTSASNAATSATNAASSASSASTSESNASTSASNASTSETNASNSASAASTSATNASNSATAASTSATSAASSATSASTSATSAANSLSSFQGQYSTGANDPTTNLDAGDLFFNTTSDTLKVYTGSAWEQGVTAGSGFLPLSGGALTGNLQLNSADIVTTSNNDISLLPNGSGKVVMDGNGSSGGISIADGLMEMRSGNSSPAQIDLYCEVSNLHKVSIKAPAHANYSGNVNFTLPPNNGTNGQFLQTDGSGNLSYATVSQPSNATTSTAGLMSAADKTKMDGIESGATGDQTASEILTAVKTVDGSGSGLDADTVDGIQGANFVRSDVNDTVSGVLSFNNYLNRTTAAGNSAWLQQDGTGRVHWYWNTTGGTSPTYTNGNEEAASITLNGFHSTGGEIKFRVTSANNNASAGDAITWITPADFRHNAVNLRKNTSVTGNITVTGTVDGRDVAADGTKLDGIESGATADQTASEIRTLVESASDSNVFTDADHTKLNGIEASADVTDATNVNAAGAAIFSTTPTANITDGTNGQVLTTNGSGTLSFTTPTGGISNVVEDTTPQLGGALDTNGKNIEFGDSVYGNQGVNTLKFGASGDLEIYHDQYNSWIKEKGTGGLNFETNGGYVQFQSTSNGVLQKMTAGGSVFLTYSGSKAIETYNNGVEITGSITTLGRGGNTNTLVGYQAGDNLTYHTGGVSNLGSAGTNNVAIGKEALKAVSTGDDNTAVGTGTAPQLTGGNNTIIGSSSALNAQAASDNVVVGKSCGPYFAGGQNVFVGNLTGPMTTTSYNTFIGYGAGQQMTTGAKNVILGNYNGNENSLDLRTSSNNIVFSDGDGNVRQKIDSNGAALFYGDIEIDGGSNSDWAFNVDSNGDLLIKVGGTAKAKLDTSGNLTCVGNVTAYGTI